MKNYFLAAITGLVVFSPGQPMMGYAQEKDSQVEVEEASIINSQLDDLKSQLNNDDEKNLAVLTWLVTTTKAEGRPRQCN